MNIESTNINRTQQAQTNKNNSVSNTNQESNVKFADELKSAENVEQKEESENIDPNKNVEQKETTEEAEKDEKTTLSKKSEDISSSDEKKVEVKNPDEELDKAVVGLNSIVEEFNQSEDKLSGYIKKNIDLTDNTNMINNDMNIQDNKDILPQMNPNMNFSGNGQPFSSFMTNNSEDNKSETLGSSAQDLAEEAAILSTMAENIALANRNQALKDTNVVTNVEENKNIALTNQNQALNDTKTVTNEEGIKKVDSQTGIKIENIVKYDTVIMNEADVEVFANLVENGEINMNNLAPKAAEKSVQVSKTLADMLAKSMETNQPVRINFDNNISVIIRISRDGKITADFLPSSQVAEAYLKENLPILRQRFDENNIDYESLNQRERRNSGKENNRKKDRSNE